MSIVLTIDAANAEELITQIKGLQIALGGKVANVVSEVKAEPVQVGANPVKAEPTEKPKATRTTKPKETEVAKTETKAEETQAADPAQTTTEAAAEGAKTKDDVSTALQSLTAAKDIETAKKVLARFKNKDEAPCARMSDLLAKDYEDFISTCEAEAK